MKQHRLLLLALFIGNILCAFLVFFYFAYIDIETFRANKAFWRGSEEDWITFFTVMGLLNGLAFITAYRLAARLAPWQERLAVIETGSVPDPVRRLAARYPLLLSGLVLAVWLAAAVYFSWGGRMMGTVTLPVFLRTFLGIGIIGGLTTATLSFLIIDNLWRPQLVRFFSDGHLRQTGAPRITVAWRLGLTFWLTGLMPLILLGVAARNSAVGVLDPFLNEVEVLNRLQWTIFFIVGIGLVGNTLLSLLTARSLLQPLYNVVGTMRQVATGDLTPRTSVMANDELGDVAFRFNEMLSQLEQSQKMRDLFGRYVSKEVADRVLSGETDLGGENVAATALFADIRDFTGLSERLDPCQVVDILNRYYTRMVDVVVAEGGIVNKFGGDSLLAIFGVPIRQPDHALRAVQAAAQMMRALAAFNAEQVALGLPPLTIGIGISSGDMVAGNVGGQARLEYTVIGDPVNLAARLQSLTKEWGTPVLLSEHTHRFLAPPPSTIAARRQITVRGKQQPTLVYELVADGQ
ncbi:MAG: adenylate/guanylate cyclase domain-containing protein [Chloroflexota bacterium]